VGFAGGDIPALPANLPLTKGSALVGVDYRQFAAVFESQRADQELDELLDWVKSGKLDPPAGRIFAFTEYRQALAFALSGQGWPRPSCPWILPTSISHRFTNFDGRRAPRHFLTSR
jgi:NADPH:quinone reductase-like Zn-dependent oxidoreductase